MAVKALGRAKRYFNGEWRAFRGAHSEVLLRDSLTSGINESALIKFEEEFDLWYLEFLRGDSTWFLCAGCVFDIDLSGEQQQAVLLATLAKNPAAVRRLTREILSVLDQEFKGLPFKVYASGSKGLHVYVKNPKGFLVSRSSNTEFTMERINHFLESGFSAEFLKLIDKSPYAHNKGIRPFTCEHPKSGIVPFVVHEQDWPDDSQENFIHWLCSALDTSDNNESVIPVAAARQEVIPRVRQQRPAAPAVVSVLQEVSGFFDDRQQSLKEWIESKLENGQQQRVTKVQTTLKYSIFVASSSAAQRIVTDDQLASGSWCPIAMKFHKTRCCGWDETYENRVCVASCFNAKCSSKKFVLRRPIRLPITLPPDWPRIEEQAGEDHLIHYENEQNQRYLPAERLKADIDRLKKLCVCAPMGCGKTHVTSEWISERLHKDDPVLIIGSRIQQIAAWHSKFTNLGFKNYETLKGSLYGVPRLLICLNSLPRLFGQETTYSGFGSARPLPKFKALIIDEADSLARWLAGPLLTESPLIFQVLNLLVRSSEYVLCMDGLPTLAMGEMIYQFGQYQAFHWVVFSSLKFKQWTFVNNHTYFTECFLSALRSGNRLFFVTNSKTAVFRFYDLATKECGLPANRILAIHGEMSRSTRDRCGNPDDWQNYDLVLANGSLGPGASFDHRWFHQVFCLADVKCGVIPQDIAQLVERVRNPIKNQVVAMVLKKSYDELLADRHAQGPEAIQSERLGQIGLYASDVYPYWQPHSMVSPARASRSSLVSSCPTVFPDYPAAHMHFPERHQIANVAPQPLGQEQSNITTIPVWNEETESLEARVHSGFHGLVFEQTPLVKLQSIVLNQTNKETSDSEDFLKTLQKICSRNGSGFTTKGPRTLLDGKGKDLVLGGMAGYLKVLGKRVSMDKVTGRSTDVEKCESDPMLNRVDHALTQLDEAAPEASTLLKSYLYSGSGGSNLTQNLIRLRSLIQQYDGTEQCIRDQIRKDVIKLFQVPATEQRLSLVTSGSETAIRSSSIARVCLNHTPTMGEVFFCVHILLALMGFRMTAKGQILAEEPFSTLTFYLGTNQQAWWDSIRYCVLVLSRQGQYRNTFKLKTLLKNQQVPSELSVAHQVVFCHLYSIFEFMGVSFAHQKVRKVVQVGSEKKKRLWHVISLDTIRYSLHMALLGFDMKGDDLPVTDAIKSVLCAHPELLAVVPSVPSQ